ncbi:hypothetical protein BSKO_03932 [Bryopsis sp. KO-2023]|nr:hypothetical protein BSKO_03932 [Bryopsis sp. KO-2023]
MAAVLFKVFALALRTAAKPLGYQFQDWALQHPTFRKNAVGFAQYLHKFEVWVSRGAEGKDSKAFVGAMTDEKALEMASKVVSEGFVFTVGVGVLSWEYYRSKIREMEKAAKDEQHRKEMIIQAKLERERLEAVNQEQTQMIDGMVARVDELERKIHSFYSDQLQAGTPWWKIWGPRS